MNLLAPIFLFLSAGFGSAYVIKPLSNGELANEVAKAFLNTPDCFKYNIFGLGSGRGDLRYQIDIDKVRAVKCKFRMPMPIGGGLEKLMTAKKIPTAKDNDGARGSERAVANDKLVKLLEEIGTEQLVVKDKTFRTKIDVKTEVEAKKAGPQKEDGPKWARPKPEAKKDEKPEAKKDEAKKEEGSPAPKAQSSTVPSWRRNKRAANMEDARPRRKRSKRVKFVIDSDSDESPPRSPSWRKTTTYSRPVWRHYSTSSKPGYRRTEKVVRERTVTVEETDSSDSDEIPRRRGRPASRSPRRRYSSSSDSSNHRWIQNRRTGNWSKVVVDDESSGRSSKWKKVGEEKSPSKSPEKAKAVKEDPSKDSIAVKLTLVEAGAVLEKFMGYFSKFIAKKGKDKGDKLCPVLKEFDSKHAQLKTITDVSFVAAAFKEYKTALKSIDLYQEEQIRLAPKSVTCAYDLSLIYVAAQFGKHLLDKIKADRMDTGKELTESKQELVSQILGLFDGMEAEMKKGKPNESTRDKALRTEAQEVIREQAEVLKEHRKKPNEEVVGDSMGEVLHALRRVANHKDSAHQSTLKELHGYWHGLVDDGPYWLIKKSVSGLEKCGPGADGLKKCLNGAKGKLAEVAADIEDWNGSLKQISPDDWKWLSAIKFELTWSDI